LTTEISRLRIGTRASKLARWQADHVAGLLAAIPGAPGVELVPIKTEGDRIQDVPLSKILGKAFFTKEIESALLEGEVDVAVHSLKDLATEMPVGLSLGAVLERASPLDALVSRDLRGNVPTRVRKLDRGDYDAIVLAVAGLERLSMGDRVSAILPPEVFPPAVSQGAIGIQIRAEDSETRRWVERLDHTPTRLATASERALLATLEGGCQVPVGALADVSADRLDLVAGICSPDGTLYVEGTGSGYASDGVEVGRILARDLLGRGGATILAAIRKEEGGA
jgi:hydroxymethylbilane synthase